MLNKRIITSQQLKPHSHSLHLYYSSSSPPSNQQAPPTASLISTVVSILTNHRSKSRWTHIHSLFSSSGFTPTEFSQVTLHLKNNPHLALSFFHFSTRKSLCNHNLLSYSTLIHVLSRHRLVTHARDLIRVAIRTPELQCSNKDANFVKPLKVFESLAKTYKICGSAPFVFDLLILECLEAKKLDGSLEIARLLRSRGISPRVSTCNALVSEVSRCRGACVGYGVYRQLFGLDCEIDGDVKWVVRVRPNVHTFNTLIVHFYGDGLLEKVEEIWEEMMALNCVANVYSYCVLMAVFCDQGMMREAERLWEEMKLNGLEYDVVAYNTIIGGFCKIGEVKRAEEFFREMGLSGLESNYVTYEHIVKGYCHVGDVNSAILVFKDLCRKGFRAEALTMDVLIGGLCDKRRVAEALEITRFSMRYFGFCPTRKSYEFLTKGLCGEGKMEEALKLQAEMVGQGFEPNLEIYEAFVDGYLKEGNEEMAAKLRKEMFEVQKQQEEQ
ncbi:PPR domain-containing protein/PPR_1 domain-containing protein/PPR_2 domain-containing protein [Cephalotus follicularis]|uniref:PPR domain-containing protein/PPR_1 domain-containing protein/PPR_2 domain-containing protein n=1 Tax=Cephalotus follicularis TaxID=3775 RepID=A0A1Q3BGP9_CEPFO|nr:PPR domain-containing protein/PPR_1 domain-containing protein/PPR_2 domain-containing protein [Cephalotus follicularis]